MSGASFPCLKCGLSPRNSVHENVSRFGHHPWVETPEKKPVIDPDIEQIALDMVISLRQEVGKIMRDGGVAQEQIQSCLEAAIKNIRVYGDPINAIDCPTCQGKGWVPK